MNDHQPRAARSRVAMPMEGSGGAARRRAVTFGIQRTVLLLLLGPVPRVHSVPTPNFNARYNEHARRLRTNLLQTYDRYLPPESNRSATDYVEADYSDTGADVFIGLRIFKTDSINIASGIMQLKVWMRMSVRMPRSSQCHAPAHIAAPPVPRAALEPTALTVDRHEAQMGSGSLRGHHASFHAWGHHSP